MEADIIFKVGNFPSASETFVVSNIIQAMKMGYRVKVIADVVNPLHFSSQIELITEFKIMDLVEVNSVPKNKRIRLFKALKSFFNLKRSFFFIKYALFKRRISLSYIFILKFFEKYKTASLFHVHFADYAEEISILKHINFFHPKLIVTFHGVDAHCISEINLKQKTKTYSKFYNHWNKITVNTPFLKQKLLTFGIPEHAISIVPMGIDLDFYNSLNPYKFLDNNDTLRLASVGRLIELKGHQYGIKTIKILKERGIKVHYTILGYGKLYNTLKHQIEELKLEDTITLFGNASQTEIKSILETSHLFLMTSITDSNNRAETQGIVTAEAQAMGLPIVGFNSGGIPYTVSKNTSILVEEKNVEALADAIIEITKSTHDYSEKSKAARDLVQSKFKLSKMITNFYADII